MKLLKFRDMYINMDKIIAVDKQKKMIGLVLIGFEYPVVEGFDNEEALNIRFDEIIRILENS